MPENTVYLFAAFTVIWLLIAGYLLFLGSRISGLHQEIEALRDEFDARATASTSSPAGSERRAPEAEDLTAPRA